MAQRETTARKQRSKDEEPRDEERPDEERDGGADASVDEAELAEYLTERIKPGLNRGSIPMLARSIAREIARDDYHRDAEEPEEDQSDEDDDEGDDAPSGMEGDLHELQQRLGSDWTLSYAVHDGEAWLIGESQDASQRIEAPSAEVLVQVVRLLSRRGGRSAKQ
jgi:hypothetical protein